MAQPQPVAAPTDAALIAAWQRGDEQAAAELVRRHARTLARFLAGAGAQEADLDDLVRTRSSGRSARSLDFAGTVSFARGY